MEIYYIKMDYFTESNMKYLRNNLPKDLKTKYENIKAEQTQKEKILGYVLLRYITHMIYDMKKDIPISYGEHGKPYFEDSKIKFNISHAKDILIIAVDETEVGIDVEYLRERKLDLVSTKIFTENEMKLYTDNDSSIEMFYKIWTLKESHIKYLGTGLSTTLKNLEMSEYIESRNKVEIENEKLIYNSFNFETDYIVSVCSESIVKTKPKFIKPKKIISSVQKFLR